MTKATDSLDQILHTFAGCGFPHPRYMTCEWCDNLPQAKAALLKWRDRAVVAELKKYQPRINKLEDELIDINNILLDYIKQLEGAE